MMVAIHEFFAIPGCRANLKAQEQSRKGLVVTVSIDSRSIQPGEVYVALAGENHDGHDYVLEAFAKGALSAMVSQPFWRKNKSVLDGHSTFIVPETLRGLQDLASAHRTRFNSPLIALTGTNGKTTTKEMIAAVLASAGKVCKTKGNLNNHIGVPLTLLQMDKTQQFAVIEMGTNHFGEIARLCEIARPHFGLITNIGHGHTEFLQDLEGVARAKGELFDFLEKDGLIFANIDDPLIRRRTQGTDRCFRYGFSGGDIEVKEVGVDDNGYPMMQVGGETITPNLVGRHNLSNALAAVAVGMHFGLTLKEIKQALENLNIPSKRLQVVKRGKCTILNDSYNANPESTIAALSALSQFPAKGKRILVLGDMLELGPKAGHEHAKIGKSLGDYDIAIFYGHGPFALQAVDACKAAHPKIVARHFTDKKELANALREVLAQNDIMLLKGSRGMQMEDILVAL